MKDAHDPIANGPQRTHPESHAESRTSTGIRLAEVLDLKNAYGIGSGDAWRYLRAERDRDGLAARLLPTLVELGFPYEPEGGEISNLCSMAKDLLDELLQEGWNVPEMRNRGWQSDGRMFEISPHSPALSSGAGSSVSDPALDDIIPLVFDFERCLRIWFANRLIHPNSELAWRTTMKEIVEAEDAWFMDADGERHSFRGLFECAKFGSAVEAEKVDDATEFDEELDLFAFAWLLEDEPLPGDPDWEGRGPTAEASMFLYGAGGSWERAVAENTLGRAEIQMRIAFAQVVPFLGEASGEAAVCLAREHLEMRLARNQKQQDSLRRMQAPEVFLENGDKLQCKIRYLLRAVNENEDILVAALTCNEDESSAA